MQFQEIENALLNLKNLDNVDFSIIGYSQLGKPIYAFHVGSYLGPQIIVEGAIHAREWITSLLLIEIVKYYSELTIQDGGFYFIPLVNPDGVQLALDGVDFISSNNLNIVSCNLSSIIGFGR